MKRSPRAIKVALAAATLTSGLAASVPAFGATYVTVEVLAKRQGSADPYSSSVIVGNTSDLLDYQVVFTLTTAPAINTFASGAQNTTIASYNPSNGANPSGVSSLAFSMVGTPTGSQLNLTSQIVGQNTNGQLWGAGTGSTFGTSDTTARGVGNADLLNVALIRPAGTTDGVNGAGQPISQVVIGKGLSGVSSVDTVNISELRASISNFTAEKLVGGILWRDSGGNPVTYTPTAGEVNASTPTDPIISYVGAQVIGVAAGNTDTRVTVAAPNGVLTATNKTIAFGGWVKGSSAPVAVNTAISNVDGAALGTSAAVTVSSISAGILQVNGSPNPVNINVPDGGSTNVTVRPSGAALLQNSGAYTSVALVVNNDNVLDASDNLNVTYQVYDPINVAPTGLVTQNNANFTNLATNIASGGALQAAMDVSFAFSAPHAGIGFTNVGGTNIAGGASGGTVNFALANKLNGQYRAVASGTATYNDLLIQGDAALPINFTRTLTENVSGNLVSNPGGGVLSTAQTGVVNRALINKVSGYSATESNQKQTTLTFLNSATYATASGANPTLSVQFRTPTGGDSAPAGISAIVSDVASTSITLNVPSTYVLQMNYDFAALTGGTEAALAAANNIYIGKRDGGGVFLNAGTGSNLGIYSNQLIAGNWGVDTATHTAWVVLPAASNTGLFAVVGGTTASNNAATGSLAITVPATGTKYLTGQAITVNGTLGNTASNPADALQVALSDDAGDLTVGGLVAGSATVAQGASTNWTGSTNSGAISGLGKTIKVKNTDAASTNSPQLASISVDVYEPISIGGTNGNFTNAAAAGALRATAQITAAPVIDNPFYQLTGLANGTTIAPGGNTGSATLTTLGRLNGTHEAKLDVTVGYQDNTIIGIAPPTVHTRNLSTNVTGQATAIGGGTTFGTADNAYIQAGDAAAGFYGTESGSFGDTFTFVGSSAADAGGAQVSAAWRHRSNAEGYPGVNPPLPAGISQLITDVVQVTTTGLGGSGNYIVLDMTYNPAPLMGASDELAMLAGKLYLARMNAGGNGINGDFDDVWTKAGTASAGIFGLPTTTLGDWGVYVDSGVHHAWAVVDPDSINATNNQFAVVPEPASLGLLALGALGLLRRRK